MKCGGVIGSDQDSNKRRCNFGLNPKKGQNDNSSCVNDEREFDSSNLSMKILKYD